MRQILSLLLVLFTCIANAGQNSDQEKNSMNPREFIKAYENAISEQSWNKTEKLIHPDCVVTFTNGTYKGKAQVEAIFRKNFDLIKDEIYTISNVHFVIEKSDYVVFIFNYNWSGIIHGEPAEGGGRGTSVIVKQNGNWQLISEHLGPNA